MIALERYIRMRTAPQEVPQEEEEEASIYKYITNSFLHFMTICCASRAPLKCHKMLH